jgi:protein-S-isoprenylcysteine O-methyltransferase Ste14
VTAAYVSLAAWGLLEVVVRVREAVAGRGHRGQDRFTRLLIAVSLGATIALVLLARAAAPALGARIAGVAVMWLGLALRAWAIVTLGRSFRTTVEVDADQAVVSSGPYKWVRHPSYTGLLLVLAGFGLAAGSWLSLAAGVLVPLPSIVWRIRVEETELSRVLGDAYANYAAGRARLVPRVW